MGVGVGWGVRCRLGWRRRRLGRVSVRLGLLALFLFLIFLFLALARCRRFLTQAQPLADTAQPIGVLGADLARVSQQRAKLAALEIRELCENEGKGGSWVRTRGGLGIDRLAEESGVHKVIGGGDLGDLVGSFTLLHVEDVARESLGF